jgi:hypothetical protein
MDEKILFERLKSIDDSLKTLVKLFGKYDNDYIKAVEAERNENARDTGSIKDPSHSTADEQ